MRFLIVGDVENKPDGYYTISISEIYKEKKEDKKKPKVKRKVQ